MNLTDYHTKYFAYELTKRCSSDSMEKLAGAVAVAQVDLNPHQVDAALLAFNSPLSNETDNPEILSKMAAAISWCKRASAYTATNGGKPWHYALIPHTAISENMTLVALAQQFIELAAKEED